MPNGREADFKKFLPVFDEEQAKNAFANRDGEVVSYHGRAGVPDLFLVAFATQKNVFAPYALNPLVARALYEDLGRYLASIGS